MKIRKCSDCGCLREILVKAKVRFQEEGIDAESKWLCIHCFLKTFGLYSNPYFKLDSDKIMECLPEEE